MSGEPLPYASVAGPGDRRSQRVAAIGGGAAVVAGLCWLGKGGAILATGDQPALLFELAPLLMGLSVLMLTIELPPSRSRAASLLAAAVASITAVPVLVDVSVTLPGVLTGAAIASTSLLVLLGMGIAGACLRRRAGVGVLPLGLALGTVPAIGIGGLLAAVYGERALEWPIVVLGAAWVVFCILLMRGHYRASVRPIA